MQQSVSDYMLYFTRLLCHVHPTRKNICIAGSRAETHIALRLIYTDTQTHTHTHTHPHTHTHTHPHTHTHTHTFTHTYTLSNTYTDLPTCTHFVYQPRNSKKYTGTKC